MKIRNIEIKARCDNPERIRAVLISLGAEYVGRDHQVDTYYQTPQGRLKLRRGNIENALIAYAREDTPAPKLSNVHLYKTQDPESLQEILAVLFDTLVVVDKRRDIYLIDNVKFHVDEVKGLGTFMEIEAMDGTGIKEEDTLRKQVTMYLDILSISHDDLVTYSYSDMIEQSS